MAARIYTTGTPNVPTRGNIKIEVTIAEYKGALEEVAIESDSHRLISFKDVFFNCFVVIIYHPNGRVPVLSITFGTKRQ